ncbi:HD-GYP domain-containing protein [Agaribacterium haliotis]|uniref:HD-GYP domain-containing protein n=1 Tax=Agaribacterium haliotis TaxID=2013869 RepID=UPI001177A973|nr:HD domain-containing phosphohydrolase [Agaribacterium haliotis]
MHTQKNDQHHYNSHLAEVNKVQDVLTTEDIRNEQGQLLLPAGTAVDARATEQILKFKLLKPLDNSVSIDGQLDSESLYLAHRELFLSDDQLRELWLDYNNEDELNALCAALLDLPLVLQKLTVLKLQLPEVFRQALFCAWLAQWLYREKDIDERTEIYIAALLHDIGLLHIDPELLDKDKRTNAAQWRQWQSHPLIAEKIVSSCEALSKSCARAVAEHHEKLDASGYPAGLISKQISKEAQLLSLLDEVWHYYFDIFKPRKRGFHDIIPALQMNQNYRNNSDAAALLLLFKNMPASEDCSTHPAFMEPMIDFVLDKYRYVETFLLSTGSLNKSLGFQHGEKKLLGMQNILLHIHVSIARSGLINKAYMRWLEQVRQQKLAHAYREVEDVSLMLSIIANYCEQFQHTLAVFIEEEKQHPKIDELKKLEAELAQLHRPELSHELAEQVMELA